MTKQGRNQACACGSGRKYKLCCGSPVAIVASGVSAAPVDAANQLARLVELANAGRYPDMESFARNMACEHPQSGLAWKALSVALQMQGKDALQEAGRAAELLPRDADCHGNLGTAYRRMGRLKEAICSFHDALQIKPESPELWNNLGNVQKDLGRFDDAIVSYRRALELRADFPQPHNNLGGILLSVGRLEEAVASFRQALAHDPDYVDAHINLGIVLRLGNHTEEAEESCGRALELDSKSASALRLLAELRSDRGEFAAAEQLYLRAIAVQPDYAEAWAGIAGLRRMSVGDSAWLAGAQRVVARARSGSESCLRYALGKYFDDVGDHEQAFANYRRANELAAQSLPAHDRRRLSTDIDRIIRHFDKDWFERVAAASAPGSSKRPVFIVGMPRSGTTLAEQILASHPAVFGAGERSYWNTFAGEYAACGKDDEADTLRRAAEGYLTLLSDLSAAERVVDKMPGNFLHLGLIHAALPGAKIIHLRRNPIDTCLSIYFQDFGALHPYANDLEDLAHYYRQYLRITAHWSQTLPCDRILEVPYEGLVEDTEAWGRRMLDFIGLPWDRRCLEFHETIRTVSTFSKWQARQKISRSSIERWRRYERFVGPLMPLCPDMPAIHRAMAGSAAG